MNAHLSQSTIGRYSPREYSLHRDGMITLSIEEIHSILFYTIYLRIVVYSEWVESIWRVDGELVVSG